MDQSEFTYEIAKKYIRVFFSPIDGSVTEEERENALALFDHRIALGYSPQDAFESVVNEFYADRETDETIIVRMRGLATEEEYPGTWRVLWSIYQEYRPVFCPYIAFQMYLGWVQKNSDLVANWLVVEGMARKMVENGMHPELAQAMAMAMVGME